MRTTINIEDDLIRRAAELTGIREKTSLVKLETGKASSVGLRGLQMPGCNDAENQVR